MKAFASVTVAEISVEHEARSYLQKIRKISSSSFSSLSEAMAILEQLRAESYEDLNQIQHEYLIIRAVRWLTDEGICPIDTVWEWNPRQTGTIDEPDLRGTAAGTVMLSAEVTASPRPIGQVDRRMFHTLSKLATSPGLKYYFVRTEQMAKRANSKITKAGWAINVCSLT